MDIKILEQEAHKNIKPEYRNFPCVTWKASKDLSDLCAKLADHVANERVVIAPQPLNEHGRRPLNQSVALSRIERYELRTQVGYILQDLAMMASLLGFTLDDVADDMIDLQGVYAV